MRGHQVLNIILNRHLGKFGISGYSDEHTQAVKATFEFIKNLPKTTTLTIATDYGDLCNRCKYNPECYVNPQRDLEALKILEATLGIISTSLTIDMLFTEIELDKYLEIRDLMYPPS